MIVTNWKWRRLTAVFAVCALSACVATTPHWDAQFGASVKSAVSQQTCNPEAVRNTDPVAGLDGRAAGAVLERYEKTFSAPPQQQNIFTIGIGAR